MNTCSPSMIQYAAHPFTEEQIQYLNRGPSYVSPCQMHHECLSPSALNDLLTKQMAPLKRDLATLFIEYPCNRLYQMEFEQDIEKLFNECFNQTVPKNIEERAKDEKVLINSIQSSLKQNQLILRRTADDQNTFYLGSLHEFKERTQSIVEDSLSYEYIGKIDDRHSKDYYLKQTIDTLNSTLEQLYTNKFIDRQQRDRFLLHNTTHLQLPSLYFLPKPDGNFGTMFEPRFSSFYDTPLYHVAQYLDQLLRPTFETYARSTTFFHGGDFIEKLQTHCTQYPQTFTAKTQLVTYEIHELHTHVWQSRLIRCLRAFLINPQIKVRQQELSNEAIEELVQMILLHNFFNFDGKVYRFRRGCPLNLPLSQLLMDIYLQEWQQPLREYVQSSRSFNGRFHTNGFLLWNDTHDHLVALFDRLESSLDSDIRMTYTIHQNVHFLNAYIENRASLLYTRVYHDPNEQPFLLPYVSTYPRRAHRLWFRHALIRAGQYCSTYDDFQDERLYLELTMLANGYSLEFVEYHLRRFYEHFNPNTDQTLALSRYNYRSFRRLLFHSIGQNRAHLLQERKLRQAGKLFELHYFFDWGARCEFEENFQKIWATFSNKNDAFKKNGIHIRLTATHYYTSNRLFSYMPIPE